MRHSASSELAPFVNVHLMLLQDSALSEVPREIIAEERCNTEWALRVQLDELTAQFDDIEDEYLRERETTCARWPSACWGRSPAPSGASSRDPPARTRPSSSRATSRPPT